MHPAFTAALLAFWLGRGRGIASQVMGSFLLVSKNVETWILWLECGAGSSASLATETVCVCVCGGGITMYIIPSKQ